MLYSEIERTALVEERMVAATGVLSAIGEAFGGGKAKAMRRFRQMLDPESPETAGAALGGSGLMHALRGRVNLGLPGPVRSEVPW